MEEKKLKAPCTMDSSSKMTMDPYEESSVLVYLVSSGNEKVECYDFQELYEWMKKQERLYYWNIKTSSAQQTKPIYKLPHSGRWVDQSVFDFLFVNKHSTLILFLKDKSVPIGSSFGISQTHGAPEDIYASFPVSESVLEDSTTLQAIMKTILPKRTYEGSLISIPLVEPIDVPPLAEDIPQLGGYESDESGGFQGVEFFLDGSDDVPNVIEKFDGTFLHEYYDYDPRPLRSLVIRAPTTIKQVDLSDFLNLTEVEIVGCGLTSTKGFNSLSQLVYLTLRNNEISSLEELGGLSSLTFLQLDKNKIESIENIGTFNLPSLETLYLRENNIREITEDSGVDSMPNLQDIILIPQKHGQPVKNKTLTFATNQLGDFEKFAEEE